MACIDKINTDTVYYTDRTNLLMLSAVLPLLSPDPTKRSVDHSIVKCLLRGASSCYPGSAPYWLCASWGWPPAVHNSTNIKCYIQCKSFLTDVKEVHTNKLTITSWWCNVLWAHVCAWLLTQRSVELCCVPAQDRGVSFGRLVLDGCLGLEGAVLMQHWLGCYYTLHPRLVLFMFYRLTDSEKPQISQKKHLDFHQDFMSTHAIGCVFSQRKHIVPKA